VAFRSSELLHGDIGDEQKQLQERINFALKFVDDVGNPLTAVDGAIDLLFQCWQEQLARMEPGKLRNEEIAECFRILHEQTGRMESLLQHIRRFSILTDKNREVTNTNEIIDIVTALVRMEKYEQGIEISNRLDKCIPAIKLEQSIVVFCLYTALSAVMDICVNGGRGVVKSTIDKKGVSILIECHDVDFLKYRGSAHSASKVMEADGLPPLENCSKIVRSVIEKYGGHMMTYCIPTNRCGINLIFPIETD